MDAVEFDLMKLQMTYSLSTRSEDHMTVAAMQQATIPYFAAGSFVACSKDGTVHSPLILPSKFKLKLG